jgi:type II secretory pathway component PulF
MKGFINYLFNPIVIFIVGMVIVLIIALIYFGISSSDNNFINLFSGLAPK